MAIQNSAYTTFLLMQFKPQFFAVIQPQEAAKICMYRKDREGTALTAYQNVNVPRPFTRQPQPSPDKKILVDPQITEGIETHKCGSGVKVLHIF